MAKIDTEKYKEKINQDPKNDEKKDVAPPKFKQTSKKSKKIKSKKLTLQDH